MDLKVAVTQIRSLLIVSRGCEPPGEFRDAVDFLLRETEFVPHDPLAATLAREAASDAQEAVLG